MTEREVVQRLAAILAADVAGYTRLMADDEPATIATIADYRAIFRTHIESNGGRVVDMAGDSILAVFTSAAGAVRAAAGAQGEVAARNNALPEHRRMRFRAGVNLGDIREARDGTIYGDGVNIAARLEGLADPGGVMISEFAYAQVRRDPQLRFAGAGSHAVKNVPEPVRAYRVVIGASDPASSRSPRATSSRPLLLAGTLSALAVVIGLVAWQLSRPTASPPAPEPANTQPEDPILAMPTGPSIAVLPFDDLGNDPEQGWFADGLTEEIIAGLSKFRELLVYARNTTTRYKADGADAKRLGQALGVRYVVEGSVQRADGRLRVSARLLDAQDGTLLWAETYDRTLDAVSLFEVQDEIREQIVGTLAGSYGVISRSGLEDAQARGTDNLTAYECVLRAYDYERELSPDRHLVARDCLERAVVLDPNYAEAWAKLAFVITDEHAWGFNPKPDSMIRAMAAARQAVALDPTSQTTRWHLARTHYWNGDREEFLLEAERALALNPNNSFVLAAAGAYYANVGERARGAALSRKAMAINPHHPGWYHFAIFQHLFERALYEDALAEAHKINMPDYWWTHAAIAAAAGMFAARGDAKEAVIELNRTYPGFTLQTARDEFAKFIPLPDGDDLRVRFIDGLRLAGVPDASSASGSP